MFTTRTKASEGTPSSSINAKGENGCAPIHLAACEGKTSTVRLLIEQKADVSLENDEGWSPMHLAAANGHIPVVDLLLRAKADIMGRDDEGRTALHRASWYGRPAMIEHLVGRKAQLEAVDSKSKTALHSAAASRTTMSMTVIRTLVKAGAKLEARTDLDWTPLHTAVRYSDYEVVDALLDLDADKEARNNYGETPLILACNEEKIDVRGRYQIVRTLLHRRADIHAQDAGGMTALHWVSARGDLDLAKILVAAKADTTTLSKKEMAPLHYASKYGRDNVVTFLLAQQSSPASTLQTAAGAKQHPAATTAVTASATRSSAQAPTSTDAPVDDNDSNEPDEYENAQEIRNLKNVVKGLLALAAEEHKTIQALLAEQATMRKQIQELQANQRAAMTQGAGASAPAATDFFAKADGSRIVAAAATAGATIPPTSTAARAAPSHSSIHRPGVGQ
jgi:ankyrin repeat protein